jgi:pyruvate formate lyase activating enzyme
MLPIKGLQKMSLIDYPPYPSAVLFLGGCNFRCPYCQNPDLVRAPGKIPDITEESIFKFLKERRKWLDGVVITGGEPTLYELTDFIKKIKELGLLVKLDTNGTLPQVLRELLSLKLIDYVAMDIKAPLGKYAEAVKSKVTEADIKKSVELVKIAPDYEFRTTVLPELFTEEDCRAIGEWLRGSKRYVLQQFRTEMGILDPSFKNKYPREQLFGFQTILKEYIPDVQVRGI